MFNCQSRSEDAFIFARDPSESLMCSILQWVSDASDRSHNNDNNIIIIIILLK